MLHLLKRHPWAISAHFDWSLALVYAVPGSVVQTMLPPGLEADTFGEWGFVAAAFVDTRRLRPSWAPAFMANDFFLAGYRLFVRGKLADGRCVRGLYILGSQTDSWQMTALGSLMTHYKYEKVTVQTNVSSVTMDLKITNRRRETVVDLSAGLQPSTAPPEGSVFADLRTARRFAGPMPFTFSHEPETGSLVVVEGARQHWEPRPVSVNVRTLAFMEQEPFAIGRLANAFWVEHVDYSWKAGTRVPHP